MKRILLIIAFEIFFITGFSHAQKCKAEFTYTGTKDCFGSGTMKIYDFFDSLEIYCCAYSGYFDSAKTTAPISIESTGAVPAGNYIVQIKDTLLNKFLLIPKDAAAIKDSMFIQDITSAKTIADAAKGNIILDAPERVILRKIIERCKGMINLTISGKISKPDSTMITDPRDCQVYKTVKIGTQTWFAQNLNYFTDNSWCYDDKSYHCRTYGRFYNWDAALTACPAGWHLPSKSEWMILIKYNGGWEAAGGRLKEAGTTHWHTPNTSATNNSGFTGLPGGWRFNAPVPGIPSDYGNLGVSCSWWSSTKENTPNFVVWTLKLWYETGAIFVNNFEHKPDNHTTTNDSQIRCLKD